MSQYSLTICCLLDFKHFSTLPISPPYAKCSSVNGSSVRGTDVQRIGEWECGSLSSSLVKYNSDSTANPYSSQSLTFLHMRIGHLFLLLASLPLKQFLINLIHWYDFFLSHHGYQVSIIGTCENFIKALW